jgi:hypothetical protein
VFDLGVRRKVYSLVLEQGKVRRKGSCVEEQKKGEGRTICRKGRGFGKSWVEARLE